MSRPPRIPSQRGRKFWIPVDNKKPLKESLDEGIQNTLKPVDDSGQNFPFTGKSGCAKIEGVGL
jgi:hypothetical protein